MASKVQTVCHAIKGTAYIDSPLQDYWAAKHVVSALRRRDPLARLSAVREALNKHRASAWLADDGRIELRVNGAAVATL
jgi:hypothetical protein